MLRRMLIVPTVALATALALSGCVPGQATPTPTATATALTEAEAYAAAEEAFRAYIDALNQIDVSDPETFEPAFALTTGELNAFDRQRYSQWHADRWTVEGTSAATLLEPSTISNNGSRVQLAVCLDVSSITIVDSQGVSQVQPDRPDVQPLYATVERSDDTDAVWRVANVVGRGDGPEC